MADERAGLRVRVLLSSGDEDEWFDVTEVSMEMDLMGALLVVGEGDRLEGMYAPGMWMRLEYEYPGAAESPEEP